MRDYTSESSTEEADLGEIETEERVDPYELVKEDILALSDNIKKVPVISKKGVVLCFHNIGAV